LRHVGFSQAAFSQALRRDHTDDDRDLQVPRDRSSHSENSPTKEGICQMQHGIIAWLIIGALAGWIAGKVVEGSGFGLIIDIVVGIVGAIIGGWLAGVLGLHIANGFISSVIVAIIGAVILLFVLRLFKRA
jgi:uncharacterized membrane protein YeaQ/YmgE (transglycosylase-associated protein family)